MPHHFALPTTLALLLVFASCSRDGIADSLPASALPGFDETTGTLLRHVEITSSSGRTWEERYDYDEAGALERVVETRGLGMRYDIAREDDGRVVAVATFRLDEERLVRTDSFDYDADGRLGQVRHYNVAYPTDTLALSSVERYAYDARGVLSAATSRYARSTAPERREVYTWADGNIVQVDDYRDGVLQSEYSYSYDAKPNYQRGHPQKVSLPTSYHSANNVVEWGYTDFSGIIDTYCNPCRTRYRYNLDGYPTVAAFERQRLVLSYE